MASLYPGAPAAVTASAKSTKKPASKPAAAPQKPVGGYTFLTPAQIASEARSQALAALQPQEAVVNQSIADATAQAGRDQAALVGINTAAGKALSSIAPSIEGAYRGAAGQVGDLARGFSAGEQARLQGVNDQSAELLRSQGMEVPTPAVNPTAAGDVAYGLHGFIPGSNLAAQGAAASQYGAGLVASNVSAGRIAVQERQAQLATDVDKFKTQLANIVAKYPQLAQQAQTALENYQLKVAGEIRQEQSAADLADYRQDSLESLDTYRAGTLKERQAHDTELENATNRRIDATIAHDRASENIARMNATERRIHDQAAENHDLVMEDIAQQNANIRNRAVRNAADRAAAAGRAVDKTTSIAVKHLVDKNGDAILQNGKPIKVSARTWSTSPSPAPSTKGYQSAVSDARILRGHAVKNTTGIGGAYIASPGAKGSDVTRSQGNGAIPATTNNPDKAQFDTTYTFAEVVDYIAQRRGISRARARKAAIAGGWRPDGKRPGKTDVAVIPGAGIWKDNQLPRDVFSHTSRGIFG